MFVHDIARGGQVIRVGRGHGGCEPRGIGVERDRATVKRYDGAGGVWRGVVQLKRDLVAEMFA